MPSMACAPQPALCWHTTARAPTHPYLVRPGTSSACHKQIVLPSEHKHFSSPVVSERWSSPTLLGRVPMASCPLLLLEVALCSLLPFTFSSMPAAPGVHPGKAQTAPSAQLGVGSVPSLCSTNHLLLIQLHDPDSLYFPLFNFRSSQLLWFCHLDLFLLLYS